MSHCILVFLGMPGADANVPKLSFSAALTKPIERPGTIKFDTIFVNEGDFYDPSTGKASTTQAVTNHKKIKNIPKKRLNCTFFIAAFVICISRSITSQCRFESY